MAEVSRLLLVARWEYARLVFRKGFLVGVLTLPFMFALGVGLGSYLDTRDADTSALGYIDYSGILDDPLPMPGSADSELQVSLLPFETESEAHAALEAQSIEAYFVLPSEYQETRRVVLVYAEYPGDNALEVFRDLLHINRISGVSTEAAQRAVAGISLTARWPDQEPWAGRVFSAETYLGNLSPLFVGVAYILLLLVSSDYFAQAVVDERESRVLEIVLTSISSGQFVGGKVLGMIAAVSTQVFAWCVLAAAAIGLGEWLLGADLLQWAEVDLSSIADLALVAIPAYVMMAALTATAGASLAEGKSSRQVGGLLVLPCTAAIWLTPLIAQDPNGALAVVLSLFPPTAVPAFALRMVCAAVPRTQVTAAAMLSLVCAMVCVWSAGRVLRYGLLRYGQREWRGFLPSG